MGQPRLLYSILNSVNQHWNRRCSTKPLRNYKIKPELSSTALHWPSFILTDLLKIHWKWVLRGNSMPFTQQTNCRESWKALCLLNVTWCTCHGSLMVTYCLLSLFYTSLQGFMMVFNTRRIWVNVLSESNNIHLKLIFYQVLWETLALT